MADLSTLDTAAPVGTDPVSGGDNAIKDTRVAVVTSFGGSDAGSGTQTSEHYLKGFHKFPMGASATKPSAGNAGRIFIDTDKYRIERDTGSAWAMLNAVQAYQTTSTSTGTLTPSAWSVMTSQVIQIATGGRIIVYGVVWVSGPASSTTVYGRLTLNSSTVLEPAFSGVGAALNMVTTTAGATIPLVGYVAPASGSYTVTVEAKTTLANVSYNGAGLVVLVV